MTNLLSGKLIVGISIFLLISLLYATGSFNFELPNFAPINLNPFKDPCEECPPTKKDLTKNAQSWEQLTQYKDDQFVQVIIKQKPMIDSITDCASLQGIYDRNTGWGIRPYVAHRILELNCVE